MDVQRLAILAARFTIKQAGVSKIPTVVSKGIGPQLNLSAKPNLLDLSLQPTNFVSPPLSNNSLPTDPRLKILQEQMRKKPSPLLPVAMSPQLEDGVGFPYTSKHKTEDLSEILPIVRDKLKNSGNLIQAEKVLPKALQKSFNRELSFNHYRNNQNFTSSNLHD